MADTLQYAKGFETFLRQFGELKVLPPVFEEKRNIPVKKRDGAIELEDVVFKYYRLCLNGEKIGMYTEIRKHELWGKLRRQIYHGSIPGYSFKRDGEEMEQVTLDYALYWSQGYSGERYDNHKSIPFPN